MGGTDIIEFALEIAGLVFLLIGARQAVECAERLFQRALDEEFGPPRTDPASDLRRDGLL
jgi:hypothetical protein